MEDKQRTGFASELYVLSLLQRSGANAFMTFGNTKKIDIIVQKEKEALTIDVKGVKENGSFPIGKSYEEYLKDSNHYFIFVDYHNKFEDISDSPDVFIVPSSKMNFVHKYQTKDNNVRFNVLRSDLENKFSNDFSIFTDTSSDNMSQTISKERIKNEKEFLI